VLPANKFDLAHVPKVLENAKGLFSTNFIQTASNGKAKNSNTSKITNKNKSNETDEDEDGEGETSNGRPFFSSDGKYVWKFFALFS